MSGVLTPTSSADDGLQDYCNMKWTEAMTLCEENLNESEREDLKSIRTYEDFKSHLTIIDNPIAQAAGSTLLQKLGPFLKSFTNFVTLLTASLSSRVVPAAVVWGFMSLLIRAAHKTETLLPNTIEMLQELGHDLEILQLYGEVFRKNPRVGDELMDIFVDIIMFWASSIHFLNRNRRATTAQRAWHNVQMKFQNTLKRIRKRTEQIKEKANAMAQVQGLSRSDLLRELDRLGLIGSTATRNWLGPEEQDIAACSNIPFARNPNFFGRKKELETIAMHLGEDISTDKFQSFALYGTGGIGKTQTALAYAYQQKDMGMDAVLWFNCETGLSLARSFRDVASLLHLEGASEDETSEQNQFLVLKWLRRTNKAWLCIFDNVEHVDLLRNAWPVADRGKVLVTSRNDIVSIDPSSGGMEIEVFDEDGGCNLILKHVARPSYSDTEIRAARQVAKRLGGLALALVIMASQIRLRKMTIGAFVQLYEKHATKLNSQTRGIESYYKLSLATCWKTTFDYLSENARRLLGVIAHVGPDALPEDLFHPPDDSKLPQGMEFCSDDWDFAEALDALLTTSLVRKNPDQGLLFIHRLIQEEFRNVLGNDGRHQSFVASSILLCEAFPKLVLGQSMRLKWRECKKYIQHVLMLCARWQEYKFRPKHQDEFQPFLLLSTSCGWYLMESGAWQEEIELMNVAMSLCEDKDGEIYAILANSRGEMECQRAHCEEAYKYMTPSLAIMRRIHGETHTEVGNGFNNYANIVFQEMKEGSCEKAIEYYTKSLEIFELNGPEVYTKIFHIPHINLSGAYHVMKQYDKAIYHAEQCRQWAVSFLGERCHFEAVATYHIGNSLFEQQKYDEAEKHWRHALTIFECENETHPTTNAAKMKLAMVKMKRRELHEAMKSSLSPS